ncbi:MAG: purine-nucleoside phosphorylase [Dongiaceae bacterium]
MSPPTPHDAAAAIRARAKGAAPRAALVLGSGLGAIAESIADPVAIDYGAIPGFPRPSVEGHVGRLVLGAIGGVPVACLQGRVHLYEGAGGQDVRHYIRTLKLLGCEIIVLTNAAGSLRREAGPGSLMLIADHINLQPFNPLVGANDDAFGPRFLALDGAYDADLRRRLHAAAAAAGLALHEGVYLACLGPSFETPAEVRAFARLGADAVGMSTVPEVIVARHCGLRVAAISAITNLAVGLDDAPISHAQTLAVAKRCAGDLQRLLAAFFARLGDDG